MKQRTNLKFGGRSQGLQIQAILVVMWGTLSSRILGFVRSAVIAFYFGAGGMADVLNAIQQIPVLLRRLAAEGSLETALVPELFRSRERDPSLKESKLIWTKILGIQWCIILPLCLLIILFPAQIIALLTDFPDPLQTEAAVNLLYLTSPYVLLLSQSVLFGALLSSQQKFTLSSYVPLLSSITVITTTILLQSAMGIAAVLYGMLFGIALQFTFMLIPIYQHGYSILPNFNLRDVAVKRIISIWLPLALSTGVLALMQLIANYLASKGENGSVSAMTNAIIFFQLPQGLIYAPIAKVCLPQLSSKGLDVQGQGLKAEKENPVADESVSKILRYGIQKLCFLFLPASLILIIMSDALLSVTFQRGAFHLGNTLQTAEVLRYYVIGSLPIALFRFLQQFLYARSVKTHPLLLMLTVAVLDIGLSLLLFWHWELGVLSLPIANSISYAIVVFYALAIGNRYSPNLLAWKPLYTNLKRFVPRLLVALTTLAAVDGLLKYLEQILLRPETIQDLSPAFLFRTLSFYAQTQQEAQLWWWSSGSSIFNFSLLAIHGLCLLAVYWLLCRQLQIPVLFGMKEGRK